MTRGKVRPGTSQAAKSLRFQARLFYGFLHIRADVRKQVAELLPFLSPGLDGVVFR